MPLQSKLGGSWALLARQIERATSFARSQRASEALTRYALLAIAAIAVLHSRLYAGSVSDDAFVTFRHSRQLVEGSGFSCVPGARILGTSSPFYALLMAIPIAFETSPYRAACVLGSVAFAGCSLAAYAAVRFARPGQWSRVLGVCAAGLVASSPLLAFHSQTGLETTVLALLVAAGFALHVRAAATGNRDPWWPSLFALAALTDPAAALLFPIIWLAWAIASLRRRVSVIAITATGSVFVLVLVTWLCFQRIYFGTWSSPVSNTWVDLWHSLMRLGNAPVTQQLVDGSALRRAYRYMGDHAWAVSLMIASILTPQTRYVGFIGSCLACLGVVLPSGLGREVQSPDHLLAACVTPVAICSVLGLRYLLVNVPSTTQRVPFAVTLGAFGLLAFAAYTPWRRATPIQRANDIWRLQRMGLKLTPWAGKQERVVSDMPGMLAYYWGAPTFDLLGRCAPQPTADHGPRATNVISLIALRPTWYAFEYTGKAAQFYAQPAFGPERDQYLMLRFPKGYLPGFGLGPPTLFVRKDHPANDDLSKALQVQLVDPGAELRRIGFLP